MSQPILASSAREFPSRSDEAKPEPKIRTMLAPSPRAVTMVRLASSRFACRALAAHTRMLELMQLTSSPASLMRRRVCSAWVLNNGNVVTSTVSR